MNYSRKKIFFKYVIPLFIMAVFIFLWTTADNFMPSRIILMNNERSEYTVELPGFLSANASLADDVNAVTSDMAVSVYDRNGVTCIKPEIEGEAKITLKLFNVIPVKSVMVKVIPDTQVYVGGSSIGISIKSEGLVVVDFSDFKNSDNIKCNPAGSAGLKKGDMILECNGEKVTDSDDFAETISSGEGEPIDLLCIRDGVSFEIELEPELSGEDGIYRIGAWVRDGTDGIGTLTFIDEKTGIYGAVGHGINDSDLNMLYSVGSGYALKTEIVGINQGKSGDPGEIRGVFTDIGNPLGDVRMNCATGVYGKIFDLNVEQQGFLGNKVKLDIGMSYEVKEGQATILTTLGDDGIQEYKIEIEKVYKNRINSPKSMVIKITDERLIERTGGIVQGMSGSPIIQNGKIIGAVTHVMVNDAKTGYGIFIESMINNVEYAAKYKNFSE